MFGCIKNIFRRYRLRKSAFSGQTGLVPLREIRSVTAVFDRSDDGMPGGSSALQEFFSGKGIKVTLLIIDIEKPVEGKVPAEIPVMDNCIVIDRKGLNWYGMPKLKIYGNVLFAETDLFINLSTSTDFTHSFISAVSKAKMKIGAADYPGNPFDIVMTEKHEIQEDEGTETVRNERTGDKIEAILKFIGQII